MFASLFCSECIRSLPAWDFYFWFAIVLFAAGFSLLGCYRNFKRSRLIADMPTSKIRSASQGYTELIGVAEKKDAPQMAPLTARPCLWWHYRIERYQSSRKSGHWVTLEKKTSQAPFFLRDSTGLCAIEPGGAEISSLHRRVWYGSSRHPSKPMGMGTDSGLLSTLSSLSFGRRYRYTENLIMDGDPLYALGHFHTDASGNRVASLKQLSGNILRHWKQDFPALLEKFDSDNNGELDLKEWRLVQKAAEQEARRQQRMESAKPVEHSLVKPQGGLPFLIGSKAQDVLVKTFRYKAIGFAMGFLAAGAMSTWLINARFLG